MSEKRTAAKGNMFADIIREGIACGFLEVKPEPRDDSVTGAANFLNSALYWDLVRAEKQGEKIEFHLRSPEDLDINNVNHDRLVHLLQNVRDFVTNNKANLLETARKIAPLCDKTAQSRFLLEFVTGVLLDVNDTEGERTKTPVDWGTLAKEVETNAPRMEIDCLAAMVAICRWPEARKHFAG